MGRGGWGGGGGEGKGRAGGQGVLEIIVRLPSRTALMVTSGSSLSSLSFGLDRL